VSGSRRGDSQIGMGMVIDQDVIWLTKCVGSGVDMVN
jgi:hypothetical protein